MQLGLAALRGSNSGSSENIRGTGPAGGRSVTALTSSAFQHERSAVSRIRDVPERQRQAASHRAAATAGRQRAERANRSFFAWDGHIGTGVRRQRGTSPQI